jgi:hypothetical protein
VNLQRIQNKGLDFALNHIMLFAVLSGTSGQFIAAGGLWCDTVALRHS